MANNRLEEAIRIVLETAGTEGVDALRKALAGVGDVSADTVTDANKLLDTLSDLNAQAAKAKDFDRLNSELAQTEERLAQASNEAYQLTLALGGTENPTKEMRRALADARGEVDRLQDAYDKQASTLDRVGRELRDAGIDTANMANSQFLLETRIAATVQDLGRQARVVRDSSTAWEAYRARTAAAADSTARLEVAGERAAGVFGRMRGVLAPIAAFFGFQQAAQGVRNLLEVASAGAKARRSLEELYGSQAAGREAYADLKQLADQNGVAFSELLDVARRLKAFGLDPLDGSLQALIDQNAAAGGSMDDLNGKVLALGQAWSKQKLQGEEILQLVERGVPVWDLLEKATGKNVQELQKLTEQGKLGRDAIRGLITEIGKANDGAAARGLQDVDGFVARIAARWTDFKQKVVDAGLGEYFKQQMRQILDATGGIDGLAQKVSASIIGVLEGLKQFGQSVAPLLALVGNFVAALTRNTEALVLLGKAYAGIKVAQFYTTLASGLVTLRETGIAMNAVSAGAANAATGVGGLMGRLASLPKSIGIGFVALGIDSIIRNVSEILRLREEILKNEQYIAVVQAGQRATEAERVRVGQQLQQLYARYANTVIASNDRIKLQSLEQAEAYRQQLQGAQQYFRGIIMETFRAGQAVDANVRAALDRVNASLEATEEHIQRVKDGFNDSGRAAAEFAGKISEAFDVAISKGKSAAEAVDGIFKGIDWSTGEGIQGAVKAIDQISVRGQAAATAVRDELREALKGVANEDLPALREQAKAAFDAGIEGAKLLQDELAQVNLSKLGVDIEEIRTGYTQAGRAAVDAFRAASDEVEALNLTAEQRSAALARAFKGAFRDASTSTELKALKQALLDALSGNNLNTADFQAAVQEVEAKLAGVGGAAQKMGEGVDAAASFGAASLESMGEAAEDAADKVEGAGGAAQQAIGDFRELDASAQSLTFGLGNVSKAFQDAFHAMFQNAQAGSPVLHWFVNLTNELTTQRQELVKLGQQYEAQLAQYDEFAARRNQLRAQFAYVSDAEIDAIIQQEQRLNQAKETQQQKVQQQLEAQRRADAERLAAQEKLNAAVDEGAAKAQSAASTEDGTIRVEFLPPSVAQAAGATRLLSELIDMVVRAAAPKIVQQLQRSKAISTTRVRR